MSDQADPKRDDFDVSLFMPSSKYLGAVDIYDKEPVRVVIERVTYEECTFDKGRKEKKGLLHFKGASKPMVLGNKQVLTTLQYALGRRTGKWIGHTVELYTVDTQMAGRPVKGVRLRVIE